MTFFFLKDARIFYKIVVALTPENKIENIEKIMESSSKLLTRYFSGLLIQMTIVTVMVSSGLAIVGVENAVLLGFMQRFQSNTIHHSYSTLIGLVIVLTTINGDYADIVLHLGYVFIVYMITQLVDNFFIQPVIFSNIMKAHPLRFSS